MTFSIDALPEDIFSLNKRLIFYTFILTGYLFQYTEASFVTPLEGDQEIHFFVSSVSLSSIRNSGLLNISIFSFHMLYLLLSSKHKFIIYRPGTLERGSVLS